MSNNDIRNKICVRPLCFRGHRFDDDGRGALGFLPASPSEHRKTHLLISGMFLVIFRLTGVKLTAQLKAPLRLVIIS